jgi:preprotein translocase subunit SecE
MARTNPIQFMQQVRSEVAKVTWPSRKETIVTTLMVLVMVVVASVFFLAADQLLSVFVGLLLGAGK